MSTRETIKRAFLDTMNGKRSHELQQETGMSSERCAEIWALYNRLSDERTTPKTIVHTISTALSALANCRKAGNNFGDNWETLLESIARDCLPSGSGIDNGTKIDVDNSTPARIVLNVDFHHMSEHGFYSGWSSHTVIVTPCFGGFDIRITGRDRNQIKEYLADTYHHALSELCAYDSEFRARIVAE